MASTIGIKLANGEFYSILDENSNVKKRLVLTTVHDNQQSVQIDLYRSYTRTMADALYIGSLVVDEIKAKPQGEPSIEMVLSCDPEGHVSAEARELDTGSGSINLSLNASLKSLDDVGQQEPSDLEPDFYTDPPPGLYQWEGGPGKRLPWGVIILLGVLIIAGCLGMFFFVTQGRDFFSPDQAPAELVRAEEPVPAEPDQGPVAQPDPVPAVPAPLPADRIIAVPPPVIPTVPPPATPAVPARSEAPVSRQPPPLIQAPARPQPAPVVNRRRNPPVASYKVPPTIPRNGIAYRIRWGDTLWDIAAAFYRNPWLYPRIARYNGIRNPNLIVSGTVIRIPPKN